MFTLFFVTLILSSCVLTGIRAGPLPRRLSPERRAAALSANQISELTPFTQFARAAYCPPEKIQGWKCGSKPPHRLLMYLLNGFTYGLEACDALPGFEATLTGGDGDATQFCTYKNYQAISITLFYFGLLQSLSATGLKRILS
jgi:hypothetical protein